MPARPRPSALPGPRLLAATLGVALITSAAGQSPDWIWAPPEPATEASAASTVWFRRSFRTPPYTWNARLTAVADARADIFLNGRLVARCDQPGQPVRAEVSMNLHQGENLLAVRADGSRSPSGLLVHLHLGGAESGQVLSDAQWKVTRREEPGWTNANHDLTRWTPATVVAPHGAPPWGNVLARASATPASALRVPPGFTAELLRSAEPDEGSWICLTFDDRGRLYVASEGDTRPLLRFSFDGSGSVARVEPVPAPVRAAMGLLHAHGSLYANARSPAGTGLHRLTDTNGNDRFDPDEVRFLKEFKTGGEHGYHALALGPDGRIHVLNGNVTPLIPGLSPRSPHRNFGEDVVSLNPDETTRAGGALAPGSHILRTDPDGRDWELVAGGLRNAYDFDFNPEGELFTWDSDAEWDWGTPWYRPTRLYHLVSGAEAGWRDGTRAWADSYPDMVPSVADIGIGSPCGVKFGTRARFPEKYRRALFLQDWSYGRILAVHLEPRGATYRGTFEVFLEGRPLNLTSLTFAPDGSMVFSTGGRGTQSGLYRVRYTDPLPDPSRALTPAPDDDPAAIARRERRRLESFHGIEHADAIDAAWPALASPDPALRYAARLALESQPPDRWRNRALAESHPTAALTALLGLARTDPSSRQPDLVRALERFPLPSLDEPLRLAKLRVLELSLLRQGRPEAGGETSASLRRQLDPHYPSQGWPENRELCRLLLTLEAPGAVPRTLDLLARAPTQEQQIHYLSQLRRARHDWSPDLRHHYFSWFLQPRDHLPRPGSLLHWFHDVGRPYVDGAALDRHLESFRRDAFAALPPDARDSLRTLAETPIAGAQLIPPQPRAFVREWTLAELLPDLDRAGSGRNFERGRRAFIDTQCYACHRLGNAGGAVGPELSAVASKYSRRELLESLLEPSKVLSEQYQHLRVFLKDGDELTGRLVRESNAELVLETDPLQRTEVTVPRNQVDETRPSTVSPMPEGLLHVLPREDILDLLAFLESAGNPEAPAFRKP